MTRYPLMLALGLFATAATPAWADTTVGAVDKVQAHVDATQGGATRTLSQDAPVLFGDKLHAGHGARLEAKLADDTVLTLGQNTRLTVDEFVYKPGAPGSRLALTVAGGAFLFVGGKIEGPTGGNVAIHTPIGTLGVRGTTVWGGPIDHGYGVLVLKGVVTVSTPHGEVTLQAGQGTLIHAYKAPGSAGPWPDDRVKRAVATITFREP